MDQRCYWCLCWYFVVAMAGAAAYGGQDSLLHGVGLCYRVMQPGLKQRRGLSNLCGFFGIAMTFHLMSCMILLAQNAMKIFATNVNSVYEGSNWRLERSNPRRRTLPVLGFVLAE